MTALINAKNFLYRKPAFAINTHTYFFGWRYFYTTCQGVRTFFDNLLQNRSFFPKPGPFSRLAMAPGGSGAERGPSWIAGMLFAIELRRLNSGRCTTRLRLRGTRRNSRLCKLCRS